MRRFILAAGLAALLLIPATAFATNSDKATGDASSPGATENGNVPFELVFTAQGTAAPKGNFTFTRADGSFTVASVSCYSQSGNEAGFSGTITSATGVLAGFLGQTGYASVQDNGQGSKATAPGRMQIDIGSVYASNCAPGQPYFPYAVSSGTVQVHQGS